MDGAVLLRVVLAVSFEHTVGNAAALVVVPTRKTCR